MNTETTTNDIYERKLELIKTLSNINEQTTMGDIITAIDPKFMEHSLLVCKEDIQKYARFGKMLIDLEWWNSYFTDMNGINITDGWIPVSESFPKEHVYDDGYIEPSETVLVQLNNDEMKTSRYWGSRRKDEPWIDLSYPTTLEVVAWMPLPNKYSTPHDCCLWNEENNCCEAGRSNCPDNDNCYMFD